MWYLIVFFISMVPIVEIRGAVPVAVANDLNLFWTYVICILGNMLPVPIIYSLQERFLFGVLTRSLSANSFLSVLKKAKKAAENLRQKQATECLLHLCFS